MSAIEPNNSQQPNQSTDEASSELDADDVTLFPDNNDCISDLDSTLDADERPPSSSEGSTSSAADLYELLSFEKIMFDNRGRPSSSSSSSDFGIGASMQTTPQPYMDHYYHRLPPHHVKDAAAINHREVTGVALEQQLLHKIFQQDRMLYFDDSHYWE